MSALAMEVKMEVHPGVVRLLTVLAFLLAMLLLVMAGMDILALPTVYKSTASGKCVYVREYTDDPPEWSCKRLPPRYETVMVAPSWRPSH